MAACGLEKGMFKSEASAQGLPVGCELCRWAAAVGLRHLEGLGKGMGERDQELLLILEGGCEAKINDGTCPALPENK